MKTRILLTVLMIGMSLIIYSQKPTMTLTFTADKNGEHVPLISILIENLTQGGDTTLFAGDTVITLNYIAGIGEDETIGDRNFIVYQNYPNPMEDKTEVILYLPKREDILITISDIFGRELINKENHLERGNHLFTFFPGMENLYFFIARTIHQSRIIEMLKSPSQASISGISKLEYTGQKTFMDEFKSDNELNNFTYNLGDLLKFTASTSVGERVIINSPTGDRTYYFHFAGDPCPDAPTVNDIDGNTYNTVQIGNQCWMKENLKTTTYSNGTPIPNVTDPDEWFNLTSGAYLWYDNDDGWKDKYGALYRWHTTVDTNGLCPSGWHVPTNDEWTVMTGYIGGEFHGNELKSCNQVNSPLGDGCNTSEHPRWNQDNTNYGTDDYGFSGLPGGDFYVNGPFDNVGIFGYWWSTTEDVFFLVYGRMLSYNTGSVNIIIADNRYGFSVRCLRD
jgi:uncharacterized protein (TIGR02145 family)